MTLRTFRTHRLRRGPALLALAAATFCSATAQAALVARSLDGDATTAEAYYDTTLGITWMRDSLHLSRALGLAASTFNQADAQAHVAALNGNATLNYGFGNWRLPAAPGVHTIGGAGCQTGFNGSTDCGSNVDVASSELAHLFHATLGNISQRDASGAFRPGTSGVDFGLVDDGDFIDLNPARYWSGEASFRLIFGIPQAGHVLFNLGDGSQSVTASSTLAHAWLVHDGDIGSAVGEVPLPGTLGLAALGLALLARRRRG
jgi:uncharacterized protein (TIGR03382 family)